MVFVKTVLHEGWMYDASNVAAGVADHWIDLVLAALLSLAGYLADARLRSLEKALEKARAKLETSCERIAALEGRLQD